MHVPMTSVIRIICKSRIGFLSGCEFVLLDSRDSTGLACVGIISALDAVLWHNHGRDSRLNCFALRSWLPSARPSSSLAP